MIRTETRTKQSKTSTKFDGKNVKYDVYWPEVKCRKWFVYSVLEGRERRKKKNKMTKWNMNGEKFVFAWILFLILILISFVTWMGKRTTKKISIKSYFLFLAFRFLCSCIFDRFSLRFFRFIIGSEVRELYFSLAFFWLKRAKWRRDRGGAEINENP